MEGGRKKNGRADGLRDETMDPSIMKTDEGIDMGEGEAGKEGGR